MASEINDLSTTESLALGDNIRVFISNQGDDRKASLSTLIDFLNDNLDMNNKKNSYETQYIAPNATGYNVAIEDNSSNTWCIITPVSNYANMTITLPSVANLVDKQEILINCTQAITTLTIDKNGSAAIYGNPSSLSANDSFKLKYDKPFKTWYRV